MDIESRVRARMEAGGGIITTAEADALGVSVTNLRGLARRGVVRRLVRGAYADQSLLEGLEVGDRHLLLVRAIQRTRPGALAASHQSAALVHGLPVLATDLDRAHVVHRRDTRETWRHDTHTVHRSPGDSVVMEKAGLHVVIPALAVLGTAVVAGPHSGIMAADAALRAGLTTKCELTTWLERMRHTPGLAGARLAVQRAAASAESPGESLGRLLLEDLGYRVIAQYRIVDEGGVVVARVDFYLPDLGVVVEFDGSVKYAGADGAAALAAEKKREDRIRRLGYGVARLVWADLFQPVSVQAAVEQAAATVHRPTHRRDLL